MDRSALAYWEAFPTGRVRPIPAPIAPADEDIAFVERQVAAHAQPGAGGVLAATLLGVTPRIATMRWPARTSLVAVDWSHAMINRFWPATGKPLAAHALRADWRQLPLASHSRDIVVGDGCYAAVGTTSDIHMLNAEAHRVLRPGGLYSARCFARPQEPLSVEAVFEHLLAGRVPHVFLLRWLLAMAVHGNSHEGVALDSVWRAWHDRVPDAPGLFARLGWPVDSAWSIERWRGVRIRYSFPAPSELRELAAPFFDVVEYHVPAYSWGECFPSVVMRARP